MPNVKEIFGFLENYLLIFIIYLFIYFYYLFIYFLFISWNL